MATLLDDYEVTITMLEPPPMARIVRVDAPLQAVAGEPVIISVTIRYEAMGDYFIYLIDTDLVGAERFLASDREWILWAGEATTPFTITMPPRDLRCRIELHSEVPVGYPIPIV